MGEVGRQTYPRAGRRGISYGKRIGTVIVHKDTHAISFKDERRFFCFKRDGCEERKRCFSENSF